jgi:hypothetical protein
MLSRSLENSFEDLSEIIIKIQEYKIHAPKALRLIWKN